jgi:hypothetical protein
MFYSFMDSCDSLQQVAGVLRSGYSIDMLRQLCMDSTESALPNGVFTARQLCGVEEPARVKE